MAHKKAGGSSRNGRDSESKRLGVKKFGDQAVVAGNILIRQRGTKYHAGVSRDGLRLELHCTAWRTLIIARAMSRWRLCNNDWELSVNWFSV